MHRIVSGITTLRQHIATLRSTIPAKRIAARSRWGIV